MPAKFISMSETTYAESRGKKPFDWNAFLKRASRDQVNERECQHARQLARDWITCAFGNQCSVLPRGSRGVPKDDAAQTLGYKFDTAVSGYDWIKAKAVLAQIEARSTELLAAMQPEQP